MVTDLTALTNNIVEGAKLGDAQRQGQLAKVNSLGMKPSRQDFFRSVRTACAVISVVIQIVGLALLIHFRPR